MRQAEEEAARKEQEERTRIANEQKMAEEVRVFVDVLFSFHFFNLVFFLLL